jgi:hypothetical protein
MESTDFILRSTGAWRARRSCPAAEVVVSVINDRKTVVLRFFSKFILFGFIVWRNSLLVLRLKSQKYGAKVENIFLKDAEMYYR